MKWNHKILSILSKPIGGKFCLWVKQLFFVRWYSVLIFTELNKHIGNGLVRVDTYDFKKSCSVKTELLPTTVEVHEGDLRFKYGAVLVAIDGQKMSTGKKCDLEIFVYSALPVGEILIIEKDVP